MWNLQINDEQKSACNAYFLPTKFKSNIYCRIIALPCLKVNQAENLDTIYKQNLMMIEWSIWNKSDGIRVCLTSDVKTSVG